MIVRSAPIIIEERMTNINRFYFLNMYIMPRDFKEHFIWTYCDLVRWLDQKVEDWFGVLKVFHLWECPRDIHVFQIILQELPK